MHPISTPVAIPGKLGNPNTSIDPFPAIGLGGLSQTSTPKHGHDASGIGG